MLASFILDDPNKEGPPRIEEVIAEIEKRPGGIDATELARIFVAKGYPIVNVQRAMQYILSSGQVELGEHLRLTMPSRVAA